MSEFKKEEMNSSSDPWWDKPKNGTEIPTNTTRK